MYYVTLVYQVSGQSRALWSEEIESLQILAGIVAASVPILTEASKDHPGSYQLVTDTDISAFRAARHVEGSRVQVLPFSHGKYGLWLASDRTHHYDLYTFHRAEFLQGVISLARACQVDFRNYLYGVPFDTQGTLYVLAGYRMLSSNFAVDVLDSNDMEEEEKDNENLIESFRKDY